MTQAGIEPATVQFVAQHFNHCATAVPCFQLLSIRISNRILLRNTYIGKCSTADWEPGTRNICTIRLDSLLIGCCSSEPTNALCSILCILLSVCSETFRSKLIVTHLIHRMEQFVGADTIFNSFHRARSKQYET